MYSTPSELIAEGLEGELSFDITFGFDGDYQAAALGLSPAEMQSAVVVDDPANDINAALGTGVGFNWHYFYVYPGTSMARFSLFDNYTDGNDDMDLYVWGPAFNFLGDSGSMTSAEQVDVVSPEAGWHYVAVHGWQTDGLEAAYTLFGWQVGANAGNMSIDTPATAGLGVTGTVNLSWAGLDAGQKYLGAVQHQSNGDSLGITLISVATD